MENALFGALAVAGVWWLTRQLFGPRAAVAAVAFAAFYPESVAQSVLVLSDTPFCALMLVQIGLWVAAYKLGESFPQSGARDRENVASGVGRGAGRRGGDVGSPQLDLVHARGRGRRRACRPRAAETHRHGSDDVGGNDTGLAPWWVRNARLTGHFVPTTLQVGASLYDGLSPYATGASDMKPAEAFQRQFRQDHAKTEASPGNLEYMLDQRMREEAWDWAAKHPGEAIRLAGVKFLRTWNVWPNEASFSAWPVRLAVALSYVPLLILGVVGGVRTLARGCPFWLCWFPAIYFSALQAVFVGSIRYRQPAMLGLIVLAAGVIGGIGKKSELKPSSATEGCWPSSPG